MIGESIRKIIPSEHQHEEDEVLAHVRAGEKVEHFETVRQRKDGTLVPISLTVSPIRNSQGQVIGASKIARNISQRKAAEEATERAMRLKDQFLGLVSHELRTPISTIVGNGQVLLRRFDQLPEAERRVALEDVVSEGERLQSIVENLLLLTRLEATGELEAQPIDIEQLGMQIVGVINRRHPNRRISADTAINLPRAVGDPTLTRLVLENLVINADKYSAPDGPIEIHATHNQGKIAVHVLDRGIGIAPEDIDSLFEPFFRSPTAKSMSTGMGLGLAVSKRIIEAQGGAIGVEARPGGGSDFYFTLDVLDTEPSGRFGPARILVVDDDPAIVRMIRLTLIAEGLEVETAEDGVVGLEKASAEAFDAVVLDLEMPRMDGRTLFRELRGRGHNVPVLILSAYGAAAARAELGADNFMNKPFDPSVLVETVRTLAHKQGAE